MSLLDKTLDNTFMPTSDINCSQPTPNIDKQLYKKYGYAQEHIDCIENPIKPMK